MCLNEKLTFNIKIKSRNCELFVLKKNDFLRLSVNFKEFIENFLHKSLMKYLKFNEEKNKMIKEFEALMSKCNGGGENKDLEKSNSIKNDLQAIEEEKDDAEVEEISDEVLGDESDNSQDKVTKKNEEKVPSLGKPQININSNAVPGLEDQKKNANTSLKNSNTFNLKSNDLLGAGQIEEKVNSLGDPEDTTTNKLKHQLNNKFQKKIDKIIEYIEKNNFKFDQIGKNPKELLLQLKSDIDLNEKNKIIEQIEIILKDYYNANKGNSSNQNASANGNTNRNKQPSNRK